MIANEYKYVVQALFALAVVCTCCCAAQASGRITDVTLSTDSKRLIIRSEGTVRPPTVLTTENPHQLVLDFPDAQLENAAQERTVRSEMVREIRTSKSRQGARVVVDFGTRKAPRHRVHRIDGCILVFFGEMASTDPSKRSTGVEASQRGPQARKPTVKWSAKPAAYGGSDLLIKSAETVNGLIVLRVAPRETPSREYKISLGVDLSQLGFNAASISPVVVDRKERWQARRAAQDLLVRENIGPPAVSGQARPVRLKRTMRPGLDQGVVQEGSHTHSHDHTVRVVQRPHAGPVKMGQWAGW